MGERYQGNAITVSASSRASGYPLSCEILNELASRKRDTESWIDTGMTVGIWYCL